MKVSVIVRAFNRGYIIGEAIESALNQTYSNFEIIVVDDGSVDDTADVVRCIRDPRIHYIKHDTNLGVSAAGNTGMRAATGDVLAYLDSDDLWERNMLASLADVMQRNPDAAVVFCDLNVLRGNATSSIVSNSVAFRRLLASRQNSGSEMIFSSREMYLCLLEDVPVKPTGALVRSRVMRDFGGFDESWVSGEDWHLYLRIARHHSFGYVDLKLGSMRVLADSTLERLQEQDKKSLLEFAIAEKWRLGDDRLAVGAVNRVISQHHKDLGWIYLHSGRRSEALATYARGFATTGHLPLALRFAFGLVPRGFAARLKAVSDLLTGRRVQA